MTRNEIIETLGEISDYLYAAINSLRGTKFGENYYRWDGGFNPIYLNELPAVDAVCVVRCKDCKNWDEDSGICCENSSYFYCFLSEEDFYCKAGCKKDGV